MIGIIGRGFTLMDGQSRSEHICHQVLFGVFELSKKTIMMGPGGWYPREVEFQNYTFDCGAKPPSLII